MSYETQDTPGQSYRSLLTGFLTVDFAEVFGKVLAAVFPPPLPPAQRGLQLTPYRELNEATVEGYLFSTTNVANLLGIKPNNVTEYGDEFSDAGFVFSRVGRQVDKSRGNGKSKKHFWQKSSHLCPSWLK